MMMDPVIKLDDQRGEEDAYQGCLKQASTVSKYGCKNINLVTLDLGRRGQSPGHNWGMMGWPKAKGDPHG
jgi:hypothetical protein